MIVRCMGNDLELDGDLLITWIRPRGFPCHLELDIPYPEFISKPTQTTYSSHKTFQRPSILLISPVYLSNSLSQLKNGSSNQVTFLCLAY